jgi:hypothetical protein
VNWWNWYTLVTSFCMTSFKLFGDISAWGISVWCLSVLRHSVVTCDDISRKCCDLLVPDLLVCHIGVPMSFSITLLGVTLAFNFLCDNFGVKLYGATFDICHIMVYKYRHIYQVYGTNKIVKESCLVSKLKLFWMNVQMCLSTMNGVLNCPHYWKENI